MRELPLCASAMLSAIVTNTALDTDQLLERVPWHEPSFGLEDVGAWFDELQILLDAKLVEREPAPHGFIYMPTARGQLVVYAHLRVGVQGAA